MSDNRSNGFDSKLNEAVIHWLLDSDPAIRWQVMRDLLRSPEQEIIQERVRITSEGVGEKILRLQGSDGTWSGVAWNPGWTSTMHALTLLFEFGLDPSSHAAVQALRLVRNKVTWKGCGPEECDQNPFFTGEIEPCINGQVATSGAYFRQDVDGIIERLLREQLTDGGWNCDAQFGATRSSFNTTICVLEALLEYEFSNEENPDVTKARLKGQDFLLERHLFRRKSTGKVIERDRKSGTSWTSFAFPTWWHYDVLRGLDYLRKANVSPDDRLNDAIELVRSKRTSDGRWNLDIQFPGEMLVEIGEGVGKPNRWITLKALRVLDWYSARE